MRGTASTVFLMVLVSACSGTQNSLPSPSSQPTEISTAAPSITQTSPAATTTPTIPAPSHPEEQLTFTTTDGRNLSGRLFGDGDTAIILAHQGTPGADQRTWYPFARLLAENGYAALAFDFRGIGRSDGPLQFANLGLDVAAAVEFLEGRGYTRIACVGASMGGTACIKVAKDYAFIGLVILASTMTAGPGADCLCLGPEYFEGLSAPKLFVSAKADASVVVWSTKRMFDITPEPKSLLMVSGTRHGTDLFDTDVGPELSSAMFEFLQGLSSSASDDPPPGESWGTPQPGQFDGPVDWAGSAGSFLACPSPILC